ncbi:AP-1 complex-associated regulatory protein-like isoform X3 [Glandiceps talaboti]
MGNLCNSCFNTFKPRSSSTSYFRDNEEESLTIEFENMIDQDNDPSNQEYITENERSHLISRNYDKIVEDQRKLDEEIDAELNRQEEVVKVEEEAYIAAKKEAARVARQKKREEEKKKANGRPPGWLGGDESEWDVAGGEDDFEMFLENVKARSLNVQTNIIEDSDDFRDSELTEAEILTMARNKEGVINAGAEVNSDWEWENDFVGAEDDTVTNGNKSNSPAQLNVGTAVYSGNANKVTTEVQIENIDSELTFEDDFKPKTTSSEQLVESEADR